MHELYETIRKIAISNNWTISKTYSEVLATSISIQKDFADGSYIVCKISVLLNGTFGMSLNCINSSAYTLGIARLLSMNSVIYNLVANMLSHGIGRTREDTVTIFNCIVEEVRTREGKSRKSLFKEVIGKSLSERIEQNPVAYLNFKDAYNCDTIYSFYAKELIS